MVKDLKDITLICIAQNLDRIQNVSRQLPTVYKQRLIEWLCKHDRLTPDYLSHVTYNLFSSQLKQLFFFKCPQISDKILKMLGAAKCQLECLTIQECQNVTDTGLLAVTRNQSELISLKLQKLPNITDKGLVNIKSRKLTHLHLGVCTKITAEGLSQVVKANPNIKTLSLKGGIHSKIDDVVFSNIAKALAGNLEELNIGQHTISSDRVVTIANFCPNLTSLNLDSCIKVSGEAIIHLSQSCLKLKKLDLSYCMGLQAHPDNEALWTLPTTLQELSLCGVRLQDEDIFVECFHRLKNLRSVRLCGVTAMNDKTLTQILQKIGSNLVKLDLSCCDSDKITDVGLAAVTKYCCKLEVLALTLLPMVTGKTLLPYVRDKQKASCLRELYCSKMSLEVLMSIMSMCHNLERIDMAGLQWVDDTLIRVIASNCPKLVHIGIKGCQQVTDLSICYLASCCPLQSLVLSGVQSITDKSVFALANHCHNLEAVMLNGCAFITTAAICYLEDCCVQRVYIGHTVFNINENLVIARNLDTGEFCALNSILPYK